MNVSYGFCSYCLCNTILYTFTFKVYLFLMSLSTLSFSLCIWSLSSSILLALVWHSSQSTTVSGHTPSPWTPWTRYLITVQYSSIFFPSTYLDYFTIPCPSHLSPLFPSCLIIYHQGLIFSSFCWWTKAKSGSGTCESIVLSLVFTFSSFSIHFGEMKQKNHRRWNYFSTFPVDDSDKSNLWHLWLLLTFITC